VHANLGARKAHHFSHTPGADCAVRSGETALHLNTKFHIAEELRRGRVLQILEPCAGYGDASSCARRRTVAFVQDWDAVRVERGLGALRPDVLLERAGAPVAAIEVFATHEVPPGKAHTLHELGVSWIEVRADQELYAGATPWTAELPLPALRRAPASHWHCRHCRAVLAERERQRSRKEAEAAYRARLRRKAACIVDVYRPNGGGFREVVWWVTEVRDGAVVAALLWKERRGEVLVQVEIQPGREQQGRDALRRRFDGWLRYHAKQGAHVDRVTDWVRAGELRNQEVDRVFPPRYRRDPTGDWVPAHRDAPPLPPAFQRKGSRRIAAREAAPEPPPTSPLEEIDPLSEWLQRVGTPLAAGADSVARAGRLVDWFAPDGAMRRRMMWREIWQIGEQRFSGVLYWSGTAQPVAGVGSPTAAECEDALREAFELVAVAEIVSGVVLDSPMRWCPVERMDPHLGFQFSVRYQWDVRSGQWVPREDYSALAWE
jgi:hypothetical protein